MIVVKLREKKMNKTTKGIAAVVIVAIITLGIWAFTSMKKPAEQNKASEGTSSQTDTNPPATESAEFGAVITYNNDGFSPATFTVRSGQKIKILNETESTIEFASDPHPTHTINPEMNSGDIEPGQTKDITVTKKGEWGFHNHFNPSMRGTMTVE